MPPISRQPMCLPSNSSCLPINPRTQCFTPPTPIPTTTGFDSPLDLLSLDQVFMSNRFPEGRMIASSRYMHKKCFRSFSILPGDQSARIQENHTLWRPQPQSFASGSDPTLILRSMGKNKGGRVHSSLSPWTWTVPPALTDCG